MPQRRYRPEAISAKLREADVLLGQGRKVAEVVKALGVSEVKLRDELLDREIFSTLAEARHLIAAWRRHYNTVRPHSALGYRPPAPEAVPWPGWGPSHPPAGLGSKVVYH